MTNNNIILLAALSGGIVAGLITFFARKKEKEPFPLSPVNDLNNLRGVAARQTLVTSE